MSNQNRIFVQHKKVNLYKQIYEKKHRTIIVQALFCGEIRGGGAGTLSPLRTRQISCIMRDDQTNDENS